MSEENNTNQGERRPLEWGSSAVIVRQLGVALTVTLFWGLLLIVLRNPGQSTGLPGVGPGETITWERHIFPIVQQNCLLCHGASGGLSLASYEQALAGGVHGPAIVPGNAEQSLFYRLLLGPVEGIPQMPLGQQPLPADTIELIGQWINQLPASGR